MMGRCFTRNLAVIGTGLAILVAGCQTSNNGAYTAALNTETGADATVEEDQQNRLALQQRDEKFRAETNVFFDRFDTETLKPDVRPTDKSSLEAGLWLTFDKSEQRLRSSGNLIPDPELQDYVSSIMCRVAQEYCSDFRVYVMRVPAFNASMAPNGVMIVWSGLLLRAENEAQVAAVIGHEIGHYLRRHSLQRMKDMVERADGLLVFSMAMGLAGIPSLADLASTLTVLGQFSFSREHEREADGYGAVLMSKAGYDAAEASKVWSGLQEELTALGKGEGSSAYSTHPPRKEREEALEYLAVRIANELESAGTGIYRERFLDTLWKQRRSFMRDEIQVGNYIGAHLLVERMIANDDDPAAAHFFKGEIYRLGGLGASMAEDDPEREAFEELEKDEQKNRSLVKARESYVAAMDAAAVDGVRPVPAELHRSNGVVLQKLHRHAEAVDEFRTYLEINPEAEDAQLIQMMIQELSQS